MSCLIDGKGHYNVDNDGIITLILNLYYLKFFSIPWPGCSLGLVSTVIANCTLKAFLYAPPSNRQPRELKSEKDVVFVLLIIHRGYRFYQDLKGPFSKSLQKDFSRDYLIFSHILWLKFLCSISNEHAL